MYQKSSCFFSYIEQDSLDLQGFDFIAVQNNISMLLADTTVLNVSRVFYMFNKVTCKESFFSIKLFSILLWF